MSDFYKMDPGAWDFGTSDLSLEEEAAYLRIVNAIHKHKGPVPDNDRVLSGMFRVSTRKARSLIDALVKAGKIVIDDGKIWNERARSDLEHRGFVSAARAASGAKGGKARAAKSAPQDSFTDVSQSVRDQFVTISTPEIVTNHQRTDETACAKSLESKDAQQAIAFHREEKSREEYSEANASDGDAVDGDFAKVLFERGVAFLKRHGVKEASARAVIGKWRKSHSDTAIFEAFTECSRAGAIDPVPWITRCLDPPKVSVEFDLSQFTGPEFQGRA